jgi:hypothetical protein
MHRTKGVLDGEGMHLEIMKSTIRSESSMKPNDPVVRRKNMDALSAVANVYSSVPAMPCPSMNKENDCDSSNLHFPPASPESLCQHVCTSNTFGMSVSNLSQNRYWCQSKSM